MRWKRSIPSHRDRADGVAVVAAADGHELLPFHVAAQLEVLVGHLEGDLGGGGAGVGEEDAGEAGRRDADELLGALDGGGGGQPQHRGVGDATELGHDGRVDLRDAVAVHVAPERRDAVEIAAPQRVDEVDSVAGVDDHRILAEPVLHLREGMPEVAVVGGDEPLVSFPRRGGGVDLLGHGAHKLAQGGPGAKERQPVAGPAPLSREDGMRCGTPLLGLPSGYLQLVNVVAAPAGLDRSHPLT